MDSEALAEVEYDSLRHLLRIRFTSGEWYRYFDVPPHVHTALIAAESKGRHFQTHIRGRYRYRRER